MPKGSAAPASAAAPAEGPKSPPPVADAVAPAEEIASPSPIEASAKANPPVTGNALQGKDAVTPGDTPPLAKTMPGETPLLAQTMSGETPLLAQTMSGETPLLAQTMPSVSTQEEVAASKRQRVTAAARNVVEEGVRPRADKLRRASTGVLDEAAADPSLRFVLVAAALIILSLLLLLLGRVL